MSADYDFAFDFAVDTAATATAALRPALEALEQIALLGGPAGEMAVAGLMEIRRELYPVSVPGESRERPSAIARFDAEIASTQAMDRRLRS